jgi:hypothetical protein
MTKYKRFCKSLSKRSIVHRPALNKHTLIVNFIAVALFLLFASASATSAQTIEARIHIVSLTPPRISIEGTSDRLTTAWSFRTTYAGLLGLGARFAQLTLTDAQGANVAVRQLAPGEYEAARPAQRFHYEVKLDPLASETAAHVSWLTPERGILMLGDLLPLPVARAKIALTLPAGWQSIALVEPAADGRYEFTQAESAVLFLGRDLRQKPAHAGATEFALATTGDWAFTDEDLARLVQDILREHERATGTALHERALVVIAPFPREVRPQEWSAETRGGTVVMLTGHEPGKTAALAQLSQPLAHELFHLWVPNGLALAGDYAWFFEGFTLYQAERAGVRLGFLSFQNYLDNMALAFDQSRSANEGTGLSLIEASQRRWSDANTVVYRKGMLVAYLYDLTLRQQTNNKRSLDDVYRALFNRGRATTDEDGNTVVCALLSRVVGDSTFVDRYIKHDSNIDLAAAIKPFGLKIAPGGARTHIVVAAELSHAQRDLLRQIGYNDTAGHGHKR